MKHFHCLTHSLCNILSHSKFSQDCINPFSITYPFASCAILCLSELHRHLSFHFAPANKSMQARSVTKILSNQHNTRHSYKVNREL